MKMKVLLLSLVSAVGCVNAAGQTATAEVSFPSSEFAKIADRFPGCYLLRVFNNESIGRESGPEYWQATGPDPMSPSSGSFETYGFKKVPKGRYALILTLGAGAGRDPAQVCLSEVEIIRNSSFVYSLRSMTAIDLRIPQDSHSKDPESKRLSRVVAEITDLEYGFISDELVLKRGNGFYEGTFTVAQPNRRYGICVYEVANGERVRTLLVDTFKVSFWELAMGRVDFGNNGAQYRGR